MSMRNSIKGMNERINMNTRIEGDFYDEPLISFDYEMYRQKPLHIY